LFINLMVWGRDNGYRWFNLGTAPLSGLDESTHAPTPTRLGHWIFRHGEFFYNFQGLRAWKEKFHPTWEPRYLAYPGNLALPRILADITALVSGGYRRIFQ
jgi:phosphatidylglycerol lysyltransferase